jgi:hypothetical protein
LPRVSLAYLAGGFRGPSTQRWAIADLSGSGCSQLAHRSFTRPPGSCASATGCIASPQTGQALLPLSKLRTHPCRWGCSSALRTLQVNLSTAERRLAATLRLRVLKNSLVHVLNEAWLADFRSRISRLNFQSQSSQMIYPHWYCNMRTSYEGQ